MKAALEARLDAKIPCSHPLFAWIVHHAAWILNKFPVNSFGKTPYGELHGKERRERVAEFGEKIMWYVPKQLRGRMDVRWRYGVFLGRALHSDMNYIGLHDGTVITARAMCRVVPSARWSSDRLNRVTGTPYDLTVEHA